MDPAPETGLYLNTLLSRIKQTGWGVGEGLQRCESVRLQAAIFPLSFGGRTKPEPSDGRRSILGRMKEELLAVRRPIPDAGRWAALRGQRSSRWSVWEGGGGSWFGGRKAMEPWWSAGWLSQQAPLHSSSSVSAATFSSAGSNVTWDGKEPVAPPGGSGNKDARAKQKEASPANGCLSLGRAIG